MARNAIRTRSVQSRFATLLRLVLTVAITVLVAIWLTFVCHLLYIPVVGPAGELINQSLLLSGGTFDREVALDVFLMFATIAGLFVIWHACSLCFTLSLLRFCRWAGIDTEWLHFLLIPGYAGAHLLVRRRFGSTMPGGWVTEPLLDEHNETTSLLPPHLDEYPKDSPQGSKVSDSHDQDAVDESDIEAMLTDQIEDLDAQMNPDNIRCHSPGSPPPESVPQAGPSVELHFCARCRRMTTHSPDTCRGGHVDLSHLKEYLRPEARPQIAFCSKYNQYPASSGKQCNKKSRLHDEHRCQECLEDGHGTADCTSRVSPAIRLPLFYASD